MKNTAWLALGLLLVGNAQVLARGVSPYLPLHLEPEIERQIERVMLLAEKPVMRRPIAAATVLDALSSSCSRDPALCREVRSYLGRYMRQAGLTHASLEGAIAGDVSEALPNRYGLHSDSSWQGSASAYWQPNDYALLTLGAIADGEETSLSGSVLSLGFERAQLDIGYRAHWLSPMTDSSMLLGTQAPTMPSITLSNYTPLTRFGLGYQVFIGRMSGSETIAVGDRFTSGHPRLAGLQLTVEPASGWSLGVTRLMQYGGGERGGNSFSDLLDALFRPSRYDNLNPDLTFDQQFGNQLAAISSEFIFPGRVPLSVYFEYAGEDTSRGRDYLLGNSALSAGIRFPSLWRRFDLTFETSEWQNGWYINSVYGDGLRNRGHVIGHWGGDRRQLGDAVGGRSHMVRLGWSPSFGGTGQLTLRTLENESYSNVDYRSSYDVSVRYSRPLRNLRVGAEALFGRDVFGEDVSWFGAFLQYAQQSGERGGYTGASAGVDSTANVFVEAGVSASRVKIDIDDALPTVTTSAELAPHFAVGVRRAVSDRSDLGARLELDDVDGNVLLGVRAIDYRYRFSCPLALSFFVGAARYDLATPAYGIYYGIGGQWRDVRPGWDVVLDAKYATKVARDHLLPGDPVGGRGDSFYDVESVTLSISRRF